MVLILTRPRTSLLLAAPPGPPRWGGARNAPHRPTMPRSAAPPHCASMFFAAGDHKSRPYDRCLALNGDGHNAHNGHIVAHCPQCLALPTMPRTASHRPAPPRIALPCPPCPALPRIVMTRYASMPDNASNDRRGTSCGCPHRPASPALPALPCIALHCPHCPALPRTAPHCPALPRIAPHCASMFFAAGDHKSRPYDRCHAMGGDARTTPQRPTMPQHANVPTCERENVRTRKRLALDETPERGTIVNRTCSDSA